MVSIQQFKRKQVQQKRKSEQTAKNIAQIEEQNGSVKEITLIQKIKTNPNGKQVQSGQIINCHYVGELLDGSKFDSSRDRNEPFQFTVDQQGLIEGWSLIAKMMREGERMKFQIPYRLAYGEQGIKGAIPPKQDLIFDLEILEIIDAEKLANQMKEQQAE